MSAADPIRYVSIFDPAIDRAKSKIKGDDGYEGTLDRRHLVMVPGMTPTIFVLHPLTWEGRRSVNSGGSADEKMVRAVMWGLDSIVDGADPTGRAWRGSYEVKLPRGNRTIWHDHEIADIEDRYGQVVLHELGMVLMQRAERGNAWSGSARPYTLPPYLWGVLAPAARPAAE